MPDIELIATDAPVVRIKQVKEKKIKTRRPSINDRRSRTSIPEDVDPVEMLKAGSSHGHVYGIH